MALCKYFGALASCRVGMAQSRKGHAPQAVRVDAACFALDAFAKTAPGACPDAC